MNTKSTPETPPARNRRPWRRRLGLLVVVLAIAALIIAPGFVIGPVAPEWSPEWLTEWSWDVRLWMGAKLRGLSSLTEGDLQDKRVYGWAPGERVSFVAEDGLELVGTLYVPPRGEGPHPALVVLHGSTPEGRGMALYRAMGTALAERGYVVLAYDQRGYGESADPDSLTDPEDFDYAGDVSAAVDYLVQRPDVDAEAISVVGHSFGGDVAIAGGVEEDRIQRIVSIGPARRLAERAEDEAGYFARRDRHYMHLWAGEIPPETFMAYRTPLLLDSHVEYFQQEDHKPIFLIDGSLESEDDLSWLETMYEEMTEPKAYYRVEGADHYMNMSGYSFLVAYLIIYDEPAFETFIEELDAWLSEETM